METETLLITFTDGSLDIIYAKEKNFEPGCSLVFGTKMVTHVSTVVDVRGEIIVFLARQDSLEKMAMVKKDGKLEGRVRLKVYTNNKFTFFTSPLLKRQRCT